MTANLDDMTEPIRALTVKQPQAWAISHGHKDVENRSWPFPLPLGSTIAIHAGRKIHPDPLPVPLDLPDDLPAGCVLGLVDVVDDHHADDCGTVDCSPWAYTGFRHWMLANARLLAHPEPCRGYLWLFVPPPDVTLRINQALRG